MISRIAGAFVALALLIAILPPAMAGEDDQDLVRSLRQEGKILPLSSIISHLTERHPGRILEVELEDEHGRRIYEIKMIEAGGVLHTFRVDAHTGAILSREKEE